VGDDANVEKAEIVYENIQRSSKEMFEAFEKAIPHVKELGELLKTLDEEERISLLESLRSKPQTLLDPKAPEYWRAGFLHAVDDVNSRLMMSVIGSEEGSETAEPSAGRQKVKIAYVRNSYSDEAYNAFASCFTRPVVSYASGFVNVCEDVYYSRADYCILPVESGRDGLLQSFRNMIAKYELKYVLTTRVAVDDGFTLFALLGKNSEQIKAKGEQFIEINVVVSDERTIGRCLGMIEENGFHIVRIHSLALSHDDGRYSYDILLQKRQGDLTLLTNYLNIFYPGCQLNGLYTQIGS